ncbi:NUDIX hydrolase [Zunongwangia endophytica]|uniref:NUDIX hydrolase n=1 Tax=Zunongwangia endophytica TaxID=1808945 RepID=A0ABV8H312_9FLAO|nr:NUDIX domain-containing protein [Zunongwangia endophytica]MDN3596563.1 NUDIX domain-containing protein [Zunongwangia endophytica]
MYKVFVNDTPIILSTNKDLGGEYKTYSIKTVRLKRLIRKINKGKITHVNLYHKKEEKLLKFLRKKIKPVIAGGGKVYNTKGEILFIYRNDKWDLPKGKIEKGESIEECAIREVEEETAISGLEITSFLRTTYHIFKRKGKFKLKETYWYNMSSDFDGKLIPQEKEGIEKVKWKSPKKAEKALKNSYANIKLLFEEEEIPAPKINVES